MKKLVAVFAVTIFAGCASDSGVIDQGGGTYFVSKQAATGFPGLGNLRADVTTEARQFCARSGKDLRVHRTNETQPPYILGNYPRVELEFTCS
ncbi:MULTISPECIES: hypothetical protein [Paraburkholderia]|uniref:Lipoprotein n=1 Tax=Paraburkholderia madseniana TaxID=2599607 RepID=A0AAP5BJV0_9BURK|nr:MULTISPECIES: hypothetical protein [Paraburkholderia]MCX4150017.1 hypothetical protein [Paraburkholderia madseniana]MCX4175692.1 hypothetical protein [Paraburkholderia madseniana]MDN7152953.1 hypothetical protein [Paraburkholderia sp. WS6]MDQ6411835.1 hypothetical protein [Paraburkholderia madseniana]MDQ6463687.1 hypothetical protein [Paraburkholderia madseniana]